MRDRPVDSGSKTSGSANRPTATFYQKKNGPGLTESLARFVDHSLFGLLAYIASSGSGNCRALLLLGDESNSDLMLGFLGDARDVFAVIAPIAINRATQLKTLNTRAANVIDWSTELRSAAVIFSVRDSITVVI